MSVDGLPMCSAFDLSWGISSLGSFRPTTTLRRRDANWSLRRSFTARAVQAKARDGGASRLLEFNSTICFTTCRFSLADPLVATTAKRWFVPRDASTVWRRWLRLRLPISFREFPGFERTNETTPQNPTGENFFIIDQSRPRRFFRSGSHLPDATETTAGRHEVSRRSERSRATPSKAVFMVKLIHAR